MSTGWEKYLDVMDDMQIMLILPRVFTGETVDRQSVESGVEYRFSLHSLQRKIHSTPSLLKYH